MNLPNHSLAWSLSLALHLAAAALLGWFAGAALLRSDSAPPTIATVDITFTEPVIATASGGTLAAAEMPAVPRAEAPPASAETRIPPPSETLTRETTADASLPLPQTEPLPRVVSQTVYGADAKASWLSDLDKWTEDEGGASSDRDGQPGSGDGTATGEGVGDGRASALASIRPVYPVGARRRGEEGRVVIEATVLANGHVGAWRVVSSSGFNELDHAAETAIRRARFSPATRRHIPVTSRIRLTFIFNLRD
ncbi:MAG: energy transducer TonB [Lentisphaerae bacterium]|nr:energy transducer TonB [Lentisphaerota bacterium]